MTAMKTSSEKLGVFDFKEEAEEHEFAARLKRKIDDPNSHSRLKSKLDNSNSHDKYNFQQMVAQGTKIPSKKINNVTCVDVDAINNDNHADGSLLYNSMDTEDNYSAKIIPELDDVQQSSSPVSDEDSQASPRRHEAASPGNCKSDSADPDFSSSDEAIDMVSDADQSISESSSSTSSDIADDDNGVFDGPTLDHFGDWEMEDDGTSISLYPDFMEYQDRHCTDSVVTFSSSSIEMKGSTAFGEDETFKIQWAVDDIIIINSLYFKRMDMAMVKMSVLSKDAIQAEGDALGVEKLKFTVKSDWSEKQAAVISLNLKYKALWNSMLDTDMDRSHLESELEQRFPKYLPNFDDHFEEVIYPKGDADAVSISKRDVDLLRPEVFVNDTIIDFYIKYLKNKIQSGERHRFHFFNSFFFRKLADPDKDSFSASEGRAAFQRVRKWTRKVNLFEKDYIIIPVNFNYHWSLIIMCHLGEVAAFEDENVKESIRVPCILHMDSIKGSHAGLQDIVRSYLCEEWKEKRKESCEDISSRFYNLRFVSLELPQQKNSYDCGLFLLHYVELFLEQAPLNFNPFKITKFSNFLNADWFQPEEASLKRVVIQRLIYNLLEDHSQETPPVDEQQSYGCQKSTFNEGCAVEFLSEKCSPSKSCLGNILNSQDDQEIEISLLPSTSLKGSQCANDFSGIFYQGSLLDAQYSAFTHTEHLNGFKSSMTPIKEEVEEDSEHFAYSPSTESGIHQLAGKAPEVSFFPCSPLDFRTEPSGDAGVSGHQAGDDNIVSSPKASFSGCDNPGQPSSPLMEMITGDDNIVSSPEEVIEKTNDADADLCFKENPGQPSSPLMEMITGDYSIVSSPEEVNEKTNKVDADLSFKENDGQPSSPLMEMEMITGDDNIVSSPTKVNEKTNEVDADLGFKENPGLPSSPLMEMITGDDNIVSSPTKINDKTNEVDADLDFKENPGQPSSPLMEMITESIEMVNENANVNHNISCLDRDEGLESLGSELDLEHVNKKRRFTTHC